MNRESIAITTSVALLALLLSSPGTLNSMQVRLGFKPSAQELVTKGCYLFRKNENQPTIKSLTYLRRAASLDEKYRKLLESVRSIPTRDAMIKAADSAGNFDLKRDFVVSKYETTYLIDSYCK